MNGWNDQQRCSLYTTTCFINMGGNKVDLIKIYSKIYAVTSVAVRVSQSENAEGNKICILGTKV